MARIHHVKSARTSTKSRKCRRCGHEVQVGEAYKYMDQRIGFFKYSTLHTIYCSQHSPKPSEMASGKTAVLLEICEVLENNIQNSEASESIKEALEQASSDCEYLADEYQESANNIEEGFGHETERSSEMAERGEEIREWGNQLENFDFSDEKAELDDLKEEATSLLMEVP